MEKQPNYSLVKERLEVRILRCKLIAWVLIALDRAATLGDTIYSFINMAFFYLPYRNILHVCSPLDNQV